MSRVFSKQPLSLGGLDNQLNGIISRFDKTSVIACIALIQEFPVGATGGRFG